ncbi:uncharacterized protein LOC128873630 [Hylaeus volcanicus]|uniref:uncharacterized protein LOC128873630 n=1 Tax=Hylaeus volcanicus TaxID=313075 RepID=UPI0023B7AB1C|nr:uncharacterized protein LOC128873630 [Hylaeus volcanicus]
MSDLFRSNCEEYSGSRGKMKLSGRKWEYPIPKSKEYWEKFCNDEERKLIIVRDPLVYSSCRSLPYNKTTLNFDTRASNKASNLNSFRDSSVDGFKVSESSLRKLPHPVSQFKTSKDNRSGTELFPKTSFTSCNLGTRTKAARIPKLDTLRPQPSFQGIFPRNVDRICAPVGAQNQSKTQSQTFPTSFSALPTLTTRSTASVSESTLKKTRKSKEPGSIYSKSAYPKLPKRRVSSEIKSAARNRNYLPNEVAPSKADQSKRTADEDGKKVGNSPKDQDSSEYAIRFAHKALKHFMANRYSPEKSVSVDAAVPGDGSVGLLKPEEVGTPTRDDEGSLEKKLERKTLKNSQFTGTDVGRATLKLDETTPRTIPSASRSTSGSSLEFVHAEPWKGPSSRVLASIPRFSGFPRKNRDRCTVCMYKPFEIPQNRKTSFPMTTLYRTIFPRNARVASDTSRDDGSSFASVQDLEDETRVLNGEIETKCATFDRQASSGSESLIAEEPFSSSLEKRGEMVETVERKTIGKDKEGRRCDDSISLSKNFKDSTSSTEVASLERPKVSSFHSESSDEDDSLAVSVSDDQTKSKYLAPCHAPVVFSPSLEPLRALRNRKPTSLQDRIAMIEASAMKRASVDDHDDEKHMSVPKNLAAKASNEKRGASPVSRMLTKSKSVPEKLSLENVELATENEERGLRRGASISNFTESRDTKNASQELYSPRDNGCSKIIPVTDFSASGTKLPLTRTEEIADLLEKLPGSASSTRMLETLCKEFSQRLAKRVVNADPNEKRSNKLVASLTRLLVDSKLYLYPDKFPSNLVFSTNQPPPCNPRLLRRILPQYSYNLVAPFLGLPEWHVHKQIAFEDTDARSHIGQSRGEDDDHSLSSLEVQPPSPRDIESLSGEEEVGQRRYNPYALFLKKPRRKVITWRPLTKSDLEGYDPDATLKMRADNIMTTICRDFCQWLDTLGGTDKTVDEEVLRDMFEIDFNAEACRAMQVSIQEMPVVPADVALTRNSPGASRLAMTRKHVMKDAKAERTPAKTKAFGTTLPWELQFVPPYNQVQKNWLECEHVPKDLETMDVVWKDIEHLKSVRGFVEWLQQHPKVPRPEALKTVVSMDVKALRRSEEDDTFAHLELDIYEIKSLRVADDGGKNA